MCEGLRLSLKIKVECKKPSHVTPHNMLMSHRPLTSTHHAMLHHAGTVLTHEKQRLAETVSQSSHSVPRGWAETALDLRPAKDQLVMLCDLLGWVRGSHIVKRPALTIAATECETTGRGPA